MMKIIIFGISEFSGMLYDLISKESQLHVIGFVVNSIFNPKKDFKSLPVFDFEDLGKRFNKSDIRILNSVGYSNLGSTKQSIQKSIDSSGWHSTGWISKFAYIASDKIDSLNIVLPFSFIGTNVKLSPFNVIYSFVNLTHDIEVGLYNFFAGGTTVGGNVSIKNNCFFGMNSVIKNGIEINDKVIVGANAFARKNLKKYSLVFPGKSSISKSKSTSIKI